MQSDYCTVRATLSAVSLRDRNMKRLLNACAYTRCHGAKSQGRRNEMRNTKNRAEDADDLEADLRMNDCVAMV